MGVRGLTTFINNQEKKFLKPYKLHNCKVLLDGNSVASNLFIWSNIDSAFGGDYDKFAKYVKEFFKVLNKCEISALVIFDGGYEQRKLKTVYSRLKDKFKSTNQAHPISGSLNFPLFMRITFREVLIELKIPFAQSDFEADDELAALSRQLQCPVLSFDSDFFIYDVKYIPLPTLSLVPLELKNSSLSETSKPVHFLDCKIYSIDVLIESFGGLDKSKLPLLAALLGNDYIKRSVFKAFYTNLKIPKGKTNQLQRRIKAVIEWLRRETFESAVKKILSRMKKNSRKRVMRQLRKTVQGYVQSTSVLSEYLAVSRDADSVTSEKETAIDSSIVGIIEQINQNIETLGVKDELLEETSGDGDNNSLSSSEEISDATVSEDSEDDLEEDHVPQEVQKEGLYCQNNDLCYENSSIPSWLLTNARKGKIQSCVIDILTLKQYFFPPQVEDYSLPPSHFISLKILNTIVGLLIGKHEDFVRYWTRNGSHLDWYTVDPIYETASLKFPATDEILNINELIRKNVLLETAGITIDLSLFPEEWHLFVVAILFWIKNMTEPVATEAHLHTMVLCLLAIFTIDSYIGVHRNKKTFTRKYKNLLSKVIESRSKAKNILKDSNTQTAHFAVSSDDPKRELDNVSHEDCVLMFGTILPYHHLSEQLKAKPKLFCLTTVHAFAQFQSCLFHLMVLNSVLGFPLKEIIISRLYSGTFVYNMFMNLSKRNNISVYVETLFQPAPSLLKLYRALILQLQISMVGVNLHKNQTKLHRKKKKQVNVERTVAASSLVDENGEVFIDDNNMFSGLSLNEC